MKRQFTLIATALLTLGSLQGPAIADEPWFDKWDHNHDGHWDYNEFKRAHGNYWKHHKKDEHRLSEAELRTEWERRAAAHHTWVESKDVRDFHHW